MAEVVLPVRGPFSLASAARFLAGFSPLARPDAADDDVLRLAFALDGTGAPAGIALRQDPDGTVHGTTLRRRATRSAVAGQAARVLSLDVDGTPMEAVAGRDPVVAGLLERYGALRPVLFGSPFDAGVWAILTQRTQFRQAIRLRERLAALAPAEVAVDGHVLRPFPGPAALVDLEPVPGLPVPKVEWLRELARAAVDGLLDAGRLRALPPEEALLRAARPARRGRVLVGADPGARRGRAGRAARRRAAGARRRAARLRPGRRPGPGRVHPHRGAVAPAPLLGVPAAARPAGRGAALTHAEGPAGAGPSGGACRMARPAPAWASPSAPTR